MGPTELMEALVKNAGPAACATTPRITVSVVVCAYTLDRWEHLQQAIESVLTQRSPVDEVVVVIDHNPELFELCRDHWSRPRRTGAADARPEVVVVASTGERGLSGGRNTGVQVARSEIVAFLDDDAWAEESWTERLLAPYDDPRVAACGGAAVPALECPRPQWWPTEFDWVVGCSYVGLPLTQAVVRNLIGANMSVRRAAVVGLGGFPVGIGRVGSNHVGCEETDLLIRLVALWPEARVVYEPAARVHHIVPAARLSWGYFRARCFAEGISKAQVAARVGSDRALASERTYVLKVLPRGMAEAMRAAVWGEPRAVLRSMAIVVGLALTTAGYVRGRLSGGGAPAVEASMLEAA